MINDFEKTVFQQHPEIEMIKNKLYEGGAVYASLSGSGSTVYGIFERDRRIDRAHFPENYFVFIINEK